LSFEITSNIQTTLCYLHLLPELEEGASNATEDLLGEGKKQNPQRTGGCQRGYQTPTRKPGC